MAGSRKGVAFSSSAATRLAWLAASMVMGMFAMHLANMLNMVTVVSVQFAAMLALCTTAVLGVHFLGFMLRIAVVVFLSLIHI